jgi:hypothetical protein
MKQKLFDVSGKTLDELLERVGKFDVPKLLQFVLRTPVIGFNSGSYDMNLNKKHGFMSNIMKSLPDFCAKKGNSYMAIGTRDFSFLDEVLSISSNNVLLAFSTPRVTVLYDSKKRHI